VGVVALIACSPILFARTHNAAQVGWVLCYLFGVGAMMLTSALYHLVTWSPRARRVWRHADLTGIFLACAGTGLALAGLTLHGRVRLALIGAVALAGLVGVTVSRLARHVAGWSSAVPYLVVGWTAALFTPQIERGGGLTCLVLVIAGGVAYSLGAVAYGTRRPRLIPHLFGYHELFHVGTLVGAGLHFAALAIALR
jgi:hemolysin III